MVHRKRSAFALSLFVVAVAMLAGGATAQARSTGAHIFNLTGDELTLAHIDIESSKDGARVWSREDPKVIPPRVGQKLQPGQALHIEIENPALEERRAILIFTTPREIKVTIALENGEYPECTVENDQRLPRQCKTDGNHVELLEAPGSVHVVNSGEIQGQAEALKVLCTKGNECNFNPQKTEETFTPRIVYGKTVTNCAEKGGPDVETEISAATTVTVSNSVGLSAKAGVSFFDIFQASITITYEHKRSESEEFKQGVKVKVEPEKVGWVNITAPVIRDTGEFTLKFGNTEWILQNVAFDTPDTSGKRPGNFSADYEKLTPEQYKAECPHKRGATAEEPPLAALVPTSAALVQTEENGTSAADLMRGGPESNTLLGLGGADLLRGAGGDDALLGGSGRDFIKGGPGEDTIAGGPGPDRIDDNSGPTVVSTGADIGPEVDRVDVADGEGDDTVSCDTPRTTVIVDPGDEVEGPCGQVIREGS
jgi:hypothetical protein